MHVLGADGAHRAKLWLEATTRVKASWLNTDPNAAGRLEFDWPHGGTQFSFDVGGILHGGDLSGQMFVVESKKYSGDSDQGSHYRSFLAKCYVTRRDYGRLADQFMWITWHPFNVKTWESLCSEEKVAEGVLSEHQRVFGTQSDDDAKVLLDRDLVGDVASRLWLLVLSDKQEKLVISKKHRALITAHEIENGAS